MPVVYSSPFNKLFITKTKGIEKQSIVITLYYKLLFSENKTNAGCGGGKFY